MVTLHSELSLVFPLEILCYFSRAIQYSYSGLQASVPSEAFQSSWTEDARRHWGVKLSKSFSVEELLQV